MWLRNRTTENQKGKKARNIKEKRQSKNFNADLGMHPLNDRRVLNVIIQRQFEDVSMIEMEFAGLKYLNLSPVDEQYTCEIFGSTLLIKDRDIYWCDEQNISEDDIEDYDGTIICAARLRWRAIDGHMGNGEFYKSVYLE